MNIGIEARWITLKNTGFGNYALNLLQEIGKIDNLNRYTVYLNNNYSNEAIFSLPNFNKEVYQAMPEIYKHILIPMDILIKKRRYDFFHFLYNAPSFFMPSPFILTIHDLSYKYIPGMISKKNYISINLQMHLNARKAVKIITISENSKRDIIKYFDIDPDKIEVIYLGTDSSFRPIQEGEGLNEKEAARKRYSLPEKYILYLGTYLPHKNLETLIKAFYKARKRWGVKHFLVLAGNKGKNYSNICSMISSMGLEDYVKMLGFVDNKDLPYIYNLSDLFIFPSLYEGFGIPVIEAMACKIPVICANSSCLPEIGSSGAFYFSPKDTDELSYKINTLLNDHELREDLIKRGVERAKAFTWSKTAVKTLALYEKVYKGFYG